MHTNLRVHLFRGLFLHVSRWPHLAVAIYFSSRCRFSLAWVSSQKYVSPGWALPKIENSTTREREEKRKKKKKRKQNTRGSRSRPESGQRSPGTAESFAQLCATQSSRMVCVYAVGPRPVPLAPLCQATCPVRLAAITHLQSIVLQNSIYVPRLAYC